MRTSNWFEFKNQSENTADLYLYGEVGGFGANASEFIATLAELKGAHINLHIHSPGGSVFEGHAIFNALKNHPGGITTYIDGIAASMASVIAMAGSPVKIASNGFLMIHNPWSQAAGDSADMRKEADVLDKLKESLVKIYADKSGMKPAEISAAMDAETWFDAEEAVAFGLADEVFSGMQAAASIDLSRISAKAPSGVFRFANPWPAPSWMRDNFKRGLEWYDKGFAGDGLADSTISEAKAIAGGGLVSPDKAQRMAAWFARHMADIEGVDANTEPPTPGMVAHALWGGWPQGDSERAMAWAEAKWAEHEKTLSQSMDNQPTAEAVEPTVEAVEAVTLEPAIEQEPALEIIQPEASVDFLAKLTEANALVESLRSQLSERDTMIAKLTDELAKAKAEATVTPEKINALATRVVASAGHPAVEFTTGEPTALPKQDLVAQYKELRKSGKSAEWLAFLKKNRVALMSSAAK